MTKDKSMVVNLCKQMEVLGLVVEFQSMSFIVPSKGRMLAHVERA